MKKKTLGLVGLLVATLPLMACEGLSGKDGKTISRDQANTILKTMTEEHAASAYLAPEQGHIVTAADVDMKENMSLTIDSTTDYVTGQYAHEYDKIVSHSYTASSNADVVSTTETFSYQKDGKYYYVSSNIDYRGTKGYEEITASAFEKAMADYETEHKRLIESVDWSATELLETIADPTGSSSASSTADPAVLTVMKEQYRSKGEGSLAFYLHFKAETKEHGYQEGTTKYVFADSLPLSMNSVTTGQSTLPSLGIRSSADSTLHDISAHSSATFDWTKADVVYPDLGEYKLVSSSSQA